MLFIIVALIGFILIAYATTDKGAGILKFVARLEEALMAFLKLLTCFLRGSSALSRRSETDDAELSDCTLMALRYHELADQRKGGN
ncbi:hypothetical protein F3Y22_tig00111238pilonHSYRG00080 [Hibiscus syriacus]|uniref:Uncharacterized protein n=1 Tax=Hibiscus syriacus TaxID=106335 RepID=A0A6A2YT04_HIBSY|nr:hypothetical protein F3Y22_tig00111238pilonHSYRG00080 [Hibiscus syriacus]